MRIFVLSTLTMILSLCFTSSKCQIQNVVVEKYYVSDQNDATDTIGGGLPVGSVTYRIYVDLATGYKISKIYGDNNHSLNFASTTPFFNNKSEGQTFGKDFSKTRLAENTVALDSWLTLGLVTKPISKQFGVLKIYDSNGSFVGGANNDGGSAGIAQGLISNNDFSAGIPVSVQDGNDTLTIPTSSWFDYGIKSFNGDDSTIFGSINPGNNFSCMGCGLQYIGGMQGVNIDSNIVLVAQLTTTGDLSFELNIELIDNLGATSKFVADKTILLQDENYSRLLKYPYEPICGCPDPTYLEYLADRDCDKLDSCKNKIVFGCMDTMACNYDAQANVHIASICCYPGKCSDRNLTTVCPEILIDRNLTSNSIVLYPNPAIDKVNIKNNISTNILEYNVADIFGRILINKVLNENETNESIDTSDLNQGIYFLQITTTEGTKKLKFIKQNKLN